MTGLVGAEADEVGFEPEDEPEAGVDVFADERSSTADQETPIVPSSPAQCPNCLMQRCNTYSYCTLLRDAAQARRDPGSH
jgi:hypothetical protein